MSALALARPGARQRQRERELPAPTLLDGLGGKPTLDELLAEVWAGLAAHRSVACPACGGELKPEYGVHARPIGGRCSGCGTALS
jgi:hypothetical protein